MLCYNIWYKNIAILEQKILDVRGTSFQRKRLVAINQDEAGFRLCRIKGLFLCLIFPGVGLGCSCGRGKKRKQKRDPWDNWRGGREKRREKRKRKQAADISDAAGCFKFSPYILFVFPLSGIPFEFFYLELTTHTDTHTHTLPLCFFVSRFCPLFRRLTSPRIDSSSSIHPPWLRDRNRWSHSSSTRSSV